MPTPSPADRADAELRRIALSYPATSEHFPWGHRTIKVKDKAFVFMGVEGGAFFFTTKLPDSRHVALLLPFAEPTGYGLGKSGWVTANFAAGEQPPVEMLAGWLDESYRAVAPAKLVASLPASGPPGGHGATVEAKAPPKKAPAKKTPPKKAPAKKTPPKKAPAKKPTAATRKTASRSARMSGARSAARSATKRS